MNIYCNGWKCRKYRRWIIHNSGKNAILNDRNDLIWNAIISLIALGFEVIVALALDDSEWGNLVESTYLIRPVATFIGMRWRRRGFLTSQVRKKHHTCSFPLRTDTDTLFVTAEDLVTKTVWLQRPIHVFCHFVHFLYVYLHVSAVALCLWAFTFCS